MLQQELGLFWTQMGRSDFCFKILRHREANEKWWCGNRRSNTPTQPLLGDFSSVLSCRFVFLFVLCVVSSWVQWAGRVCEPQLSACWLSSHSCTQGSSDTSWDGWAECKGWHQLQLSNCGKDVGRLGLLRLVAVNSQLCVVSLLESFHIPLCTVQWGLDILWYSISWYQAAEGIELCQAEEQAGWSECGIQMQGELRGSFWEKLHVMANNVSHKLGFTLQ